MTETNDYRIPTPADEPAASLLTEARRRSEERERHHREAEDQRVAYVTRLAQRGLAAISRAFADGAVKPYGDWPDAIAVTFSESSLPMSDDEAWANPREAHERRDWWAAVLCNPTRRDEGEAERLRGVRELIASALCGLGWKVECWPDRHDLTPRIVLSVRPATNT